LNSGWHSTRDPDSHISRMVAEAPGMHWRWWRICGINILWFKKLQSNFNGKLRC
jgi:hypothetical protein